MVTQNERHKLLTLLSDFCLTFEQTNTLVIMINMIGKNVFQIKTFHSAEILALLSEKLCSDCNPFSSSKVPRTYGI